MNVQHSVKAHVQMDASQNAQMVVVLDVTLQYANYNVQEDVQITVELQEGLRVDMRALMAALPTVYLIAKVHVVHQQTVQHSALILDVARLVHKLDVVIVVLLLVAMTALVVSAVQLVKIIVVVVAKVHV